MRNVFLANFDELVEMSFGSNAKVVFSRALGLEYAYDDMVRLIAMFRREQDPFLDVDTFVKEGGRLGVGKVLEELREIAETIG